MSRRNGCDYLNCGEYVSQTKIITVRPKLKIKGEPKICKGQAPTFNVFNEFNNSPVPVLWHIYNSANNQLLFVSAAQTSNLTYTFNAVGKFRVTADRSDYCNTATFIIEVKPAPATPTVQNVEGKHYTCPGTSLLLLGQNAPAGHTFVWEPTNSDMATPETFTANEVSIKYSDTSPEVCDVNVFFYNMDLGCKSEAAYVHTVDEFELAAVNLPEVAEACLYSTIEFTQDNVFDQSPNVKYEWLIIPEQAASVVGSHVENKVTIIVNNANVSSFEILLKRKYCETLIENRLIQVNVVENPIAPMILVENEECRFVFTVEPVIGSDEDYRWFIDNSNAGTGIEMHRDLSFGCHDIELIYNPYPYCPADTNTIRVCAPDCNGTPPGGGGGGGGGSTPCSSGLTLTIDRNMLCADNSVILKITNPNIIPPGCNLFWSVTSANSYYANITGMSNYMAHVSFLKPGVYNIQAMAISSTNCITGSIRITVNCIPDFEVNFICGSSNNGAFKVTDNSLYLNNNLPTGRTFTVTRGSTTISANQPFIDRTGITPTIANLLPSTGTYTYTITIRASGCTYTQTITLYPRITGATLKAANDYVPANANACGTVPIHLSLSNIQPATTPITHNYLWNFGDNSTSKTEDPFVYHTYASTPNSTVFYTTRATITDINGCAFNKSIQIDVYDKSELGDNKLTVEGDPVCPGTAQTIWYRRHLALPINSGTNQYYWEFSQNYNNSNTYNTYQTDDYNVRVVSHHGCIGQDLLNVGFLSQPLALILGKSDWCLYDEVALTGNVGNEVEYSWSVRDPWGDTVEVADSLPNITFKATMTGNYQIDLQTISPEGCSAETHSVITVHATPAAPTIDFVGNHCIHQPPVVLHSTNGTSLHWSSGVANPVAHYYVAGTALAYYYDADNGCKSADAAITIEPAPNFDGLLTGCYESCLNKEMTDYRVYNFLSPHATWRWLYNHTLALQSGTGGFNSMPLMINDGGTYNLEVTYNNGLCVTTSPDLVINHVAECPCEVTITELYCDMYVEGCRVFYKTGIEICNNGSESLCFDRAHLQALIPDIHIIGSSSVVINPGDCANFSFTFVFLELIADMATFELTNQCGNCKVTFSVNTALQIEECGRMDIRWLECVPPLTSSNQLYYRFGLQLPDIAQRVLAVWSEPAQIINFYYNPNYGLIDGLSMFDWGDLSQLGEEGEVCFHVIACKNDHLCKYVVCVPVRTLIRICAPFRHLLQEQEEEEETNSSPVYLIPNPAVATVEIKGLPPAQIADLQLLDITGRLVKTVKETAILSVAEVAKGTYIVRVRDTNNQLYYLKLIKN